MVYHSPPLPTQPFSKRLLKNTIYGFGFSEVNIPETMVKNKIEIFILQARGDQEHCIFTPF